MPEKLLPSPLPDASGETDQVGPCRTPRATRFRPGQSGNPRGRPKGARALSGLVARALNEKVEVTENGRRRRITKIEAALKQLANRAAKGDHRATQYAIVLHGDRDRQPPPAAETSDAGDALVIAEMMRRLSRPKE